MDLPALDSLRCFVAAAERLNFRAAAGQVALTPAALSQRIRQLEDQLGAPLFRRTTRSVQLTQAGLGLLPRARACLAEAAACLQAARGEDLPPAELTLGTRFELGMSWIVPMLPRVAAALPQVALHLYFGSGSEIVERLRAGLCDCAVTSANIHDVRVAEARLHEERYAFVGSPRLLRRVAFARAEDAGRHTLLDIDAGLPLLRYFSEAEGAPALPRFASYRWLGLGAAVKAMVLAGEGVAVLPAYMIEEELRRGKLRRVLPQVTLRTDYFRLIFRADDPRGGILHALAAVLASEPIR
ncbi:MAG: LysR family transcriptional regulator [Myxococcales bacterium]|nr:LysR family transcriptional regulator [Myxococcales bacterium]